MCVSDTISELFIVCVKCTQTTVMRSYLTTYYTCILQVNSPTGLDPILKQYLHYSKALQLLFNII